MQANCMSEIARFKTECTLWHEAIIKTQNILACSVKRDNKMLLNGQ